MIRKLTYQDIPPALRAKQAGEAQRRLQGVLMDPTASPEQREAARRQQVVLRHWSRGTLASASGGTLDPGAEAAAPESPQPSSGDPSGPEEHGAELTDITTAPED